MNRILRTGFCGLPDRSRPLSYAGASWRVTFTLSGDEFVRLKKGSGGFCFEVWEEILRWKTKKTENYLASICALPRGRGADDRAQLLPAPGRPVQEQAALFGLFDQRVCAFAGVIRDPDLLRIALPAERAEVTATVLGLQRAD